MIRCGAAVLGLLMHSVPCVQAQAVSVGDPFESYIRLLQLTGEAAAGSMSLRAAGQYAVTDTTDHPWGGLFEAYDREAQLEVVDPVMQTFYHSNRPFGFNDGALWRGRGGTIHFTTGVRFERGWIRAALRPEVFFAQNLDFPLSDRSVPSGRSIFAYPSALRKGNIDMPQRFGPGAFVRADWGESYVEAHALGAEAGVSMESMWWGPAQRNAIVMSNNAGGFPHAFVATDEPFAFALGKIEARWLWGVLAESDFFDDAPSNDRRFISAIGVVYQPRWVPGFSIGTARAVIQNWPDEWSLRELFIVSRTLQDDAKAARYDDVSSLFARYVMPESGLEVYGEWGRAEPAADWRDLVLEPGYGTGYTMGFQKAFIRTTEEYLKLFAELTRLSAGRTATLRGEYPISYFYVDDVVRQGYTHRGQVIGAAIGPGSLSQAVGLDYFQPLGSLGLLAERIVYDNDFGYAAEGDRRGHEVELALELHGRLFWNAYELGGTFRLARILSEDFEWEHNISNIIFGFSIRHMVGFAR